MSKARESLVNVGIDVGKDRLDVVIHEQNMYLVAANDVTGIRRVLGRLARYRVARIIVEATGRRE